MLDYVEIIRKYYPIESRAFRLLMMHSLQVADLALKLAENYKGDEPLDLDFVCEAAMLHDIGMFLTDAPSIECYGDKPYLCHGYLGSELLNELGLPRHARVCERHTGSGLTCQEIIDQKLPLPHRDLLPETPEEKLVCYADKFYSKSKITKAKPLEKVRAQLSKYGEGTIARFDALTAMFGSPDEL